MKHFILGKIYSNENHAKDLYDGLIYINPLAQFGIGKLAEQKTMSNKYRDDLNEGLSVNINSDNPRLNSNAITFFQDIGGIPRNVNAIGEIDTRFLHENVYCLSSIFYDCEKREFIKLSEKMFQFTDKQEGLAVVIYDVKEFLNRIIRTLSDSLGSPYWIAYGLVDYDFEQHHTQETDEFTKEENFSYQQEFRIAIDVLGSNFKVRKNTDGFKYDVDKGAILLNIGSIKDIAFTLSVKDYIKDNFPAKYQWIKTVQPDRICPFYPPVRNELSYICPLMRTENAMLISEKAMYPIKRDPNAFSINCKQLKNTLLIGPSKDPFFLSMAEYYFLRVLDIYKSKGDKTMLDSILTAIMRYMLELNISQCAGIKLKIENGVLKASYEDLQLHDSSLCYDEPYEIVQKKTLQPKPTDFAVLITLSDQMDYEEYEYRGEKYVRVEVARNGMLPSGRSVKKGEVVWVEVSKVKFIGY